MVRWKGRRTDGSNVTGHKEKEEGREIHLYDTAVSVQMQSG